MTSESEDSIAVSTEMGTYFTTLQKEIDVCYTIAETARQKGFDPTYNVEIPQAKDLAARVEELVGPKNIAPKIREVTKKIGNRELVSLEIARYIANGENYSFPSIDKALDQAVRTGLAILTEGVLVAPLEGIADVKLGENNDGSKYVDLYFSGPIRSAGGTGQAMSVLIADVVRRDLGIKRYQPTKGEIERYKEEIPLYKRAQHLQYTPNVDEIDQIVSKCPICINGEGTEQEEVTGYRDLPRVESNRLRGGACLVIAEGLCLKAPKLMKHVTKLKLEGWDFLDHFVNKKKENNNETEEQQKEGKTSIPDIPPAYKYIGEVIAGRPVFGHPSRVGGFRLRYGRARTAGLASTAISPAAMTLSDEFIAIGTQMKMERPGKATIGTPCDELDGPIVLKHNGDLIQINNPEEIDFTSVKQIVDFGEILIPFGEFLENNAILPDASYSFEWWIQDLQKQLNLLPEKNTLEQIKKADEQTKKHIGKDLQKPINLIHPSFEDALQLSIIYKIPLHPDHNYFWHDITIEDVQKLAKYVKEQGTINEQKKLILPKEKEIKEILLKIGVLHTQKNNALTTILPAKSLLHCLGLTFTQESIIETDRINQIPSANNEQNLSTVQYVSALAGIRIQPRAPFRIGTRMGRPEKAAERKMRPPPHVLFPLGNYGTNQRLFNKAAEKGDIEVEAGKRICTQCEKNTYKIICDCGGHTEPIENRIEIFTININEELKHAKKHLKIRTIPEAIKGVQGTISKHKTPEPVEKGILRAKHGVSVFKDGTIRFDMTDAPLTHFKPKELHVSIDQLKELGYTHDIEGKPLENYDQICELKVQDVVIATSCAEYFMKVAHFVDDLLLKYYRLEKFYNVRKIEDLTGHLVIGLAPHTSAGSLARIIGFTDAKVCFSHPFYHAAKRRNCYIGSQRVYLYDDKKKEFITSEIGPLVEEQLESGIVKQIDSYGTLKCNVDNSTKLFAYTLDRESGKLVKKKVTCFIKGKTNSWVRIKTSTNREIKVTPDHNIATISNNEIKIKKAREIKKGDKVPLATHIPYETSIHKINLVRSLHNLPDDLLINIKLRMARPFFKKIVKEIGRDRVIDICDISGNLKISLSKWYNSVPLLHFLKICENTHISLDDLPVTARLGFRRDHVNLPIYVSDIDSLFWILGMYCAEGWGRSNKTAHQISFRICDDKLRTNVISKMNDLFSLRPYIRDTKIVYSSKLLYTFFTKVWGAGLKAYSKKVPNIIYSGDRVAIQQFISAFFDGDGSISLNPDRVAFYSVSQTLLEGIANLLLREDIFARFLKTKKRLPGKKVMDRYKELGKKPVKHVLFHLVLTGEDKYKFSKFVKPVSEKKHERSIKMTSSEPPSARRLIKYEMEYYPAISYSNYTFDFITEIENISVINDSTYCLDVEGERLADKAIYWHNQLIQIRCDGDEDGLMLLMDALLNFSHEYIPDKRGGKMDLPLILTTRLDPSEVDKEAHNVDCLYRYPLDFYEATIRHEHPKNWEDKMDVVGSRLKTPLQYEQFGFTHDTSDISAGPTVSRYKTLNTMMDKMNAQLNLAAKIRAVDEADVAYKVIERHFLPDILGNLKAFSKQSVRCVTCNITYRRIPLSGRCRKCDGKLSLTVHEKSVKKYLEISKEIADRYHIPSYARQRITLVEKNIDSLFMSDKVRKTKLTDFL